VAYAYVHDVAASWVRYVEIAAALHHPRPDGLLLHIAGRTPDGVRIIDVWETQDAGERFHAERMAPALVALAENSRIRSVVRELCAEELVIPAPRLDPRVGQPTAATPSRPHPGPDRHARGDHVRIHRRRH
jgi:hypothetical protein